MCAESQFGCPVSSSVCCARRPSTSRATLLPAIRSTIPRAPALQLLRLNGIRLLGIHVHEPDHSDKYLCGLGLDFWCSTTYLCNTMDECDSGHLFTCDTAFQCQGMNFTCSSGKTGITTCGAPNPNYFTNGNPNPSELQLWLDSRHRRPIQLLVHFYLQPASSNAHLTPRLRVSCCSSPAQTTPSSSARRPGSTARFPRTASAAHLRVGTTSAIRAAGGVAE